MRSIDRQQFSGIRSISSNERAVNVAKRAGVLKRGLRPNESPEVIADVWLAWGFQANLARTILFLLLLSAMDTRYASDLVAPC